MRWRASRKKAKQDDDHLERKTKHALSLTLFFAAFLFLWVTVLALGSHAGEGRLSARQQEQAYYVQQALLILGLLAYAGLARLLPAGRVRRGCAACAAAVFLAGTAVLLAADSGAPYYPAVAQAVMPCLGALGGAVYHRMSRETARGTATARCMGVGSALATALQYLLQLRWGRSPLLPFFMLAAFLLLAARPAEARAETPAAGGKVRPARLLSVCLVTALFLPAGLLLRRV